MRKPARHAPFIFGVLSLIAFLWLIFTYRSWWIGIPGALLLAFGVVSIKTALFASDKEINELTGFEPMSEETKRKFEDRL